MYQEVLRSVEGIGVFPAVSLVVFVTVFTAVVWRAVRMDTAGVRHMAALPLDDLPEGAAPRTPPHVHPLAASPAVRVARSRRSLADQEESDEPGQ